MPVYIGHLLTSRMKCNVNSKSDGKFHTNLQAKICASTVKANCTILQLLWF